MLISANKWSSNLWIDHLKISFSDFPLHFPAQLVTATTILHNIVTTSRYYYVVTNFHQTTKLPAQNSVPASCQGVKTVEKQGCVNCNVFSKKNSISRFREWWWYIDDHHAGAWQDIVSDTVYFTGLSELTWQGCQQELASLFFTCEYWACGFLTKTSNRSASFKI